MFSRRRLLVFVVKVFILILIFSSFWSFIAPGYASLLAAASNGVAPSSIKITASDSLINIYSGVQLAPVSLRSLPFQAGLVMVLALIIATPGLNVRQRLKYVVIAAILTFALHIASLFIMSVNARAMRPLVVLCASVGIDLFPLLIWVALSAKYWWVGRGETINPSTSGQTNDDLSSDVSTLHSLPS